MRTPTTLNRLILLAAIIILSCLQYKSALAGRAPSALEDQLVQAFTLRLEVLHRDALSSPLRPKGVTQEQLVLGMLARDAERSLLSQLGGRSLWQGSRQEPGHTADLSLGPAVGEFITTVGVGTPSNEMHLMLDIGSGITWVQCQSCTKCFTQTDRLFNPRSSRSYSPTTCTSNLCWALPEGVRQCNAPDTCAYSLTYPGGSSTSGSLGWDTFTFGSGAIAGVPFGCSTSSTNANGLPSQDFDGLLALGMGPASFASLFLPRFSYCLPIPFKGTSTGYLTVGGSEPASSAPSFNFYQNAAHPSSYYVPVTGFAVNNVPLNSIPASAFDRTPSGAGFILAFASLFSRIVPAAYTPLRDAFRNAMAAAGHSIIPTPAHAPAFIDTCFHLPIGLDASIPSVNLLFEGGALVTLPPYNVLLQTGLDSTTYCFTFAPATPPATVSVLGTILQQGFDINYDLAAKRMAFASGGC